MNLLLELSLPQLASVATSFIGVLWVLVQIIIKQQDRRLEDKFRLLTIEMTKVGTEVKKEAEATRTLETEFLRFQAELARDYVRRDDFVRTLATLETRIDNFALRMERALAERKE